jgi:hypothetical protein
MRGLHYRGLVGNLQFWQSMIVACLAVLITLTCLLRTTKQSIALERQHARSLEIQLQECACRETNFAPEHTSVRTPP